MTDNTLSAESHYDDQGLFVSLIVGGILLVTFGGFMAFLHCTSILWLKRFYRPNHTIEPDPLARAKAAEIAAHAPRRGPNSQSPPSPSSPTGQTVFAEHTVRPHGRSGRTVTRRKRLGVSLPFISTFFVRPRLQDWISIEEPSLRDRKDGALDPLHVNTPAAPLRHTSDRSFVPIRSTRSPLLPSSPGDTPMFPSEYPMTDAGGAHPAAVGQSDERPSLYSPRSGPPTPSYGAVEPLSPRRSAASSATAAAAVAATQSAPAIASTTTATSLQSFPTDNPLPKTPTDPLVAIYLFTLKYFLALMLFGELFTMWIMLIARHDNYMERTMLQRDIHGCRKQDDNETGCKALKPYCRFRGIAVGCAVVPLHGIYDLTVSNIRPRSWRWATVGVLNLGFCLVLVLLTLLYLRKVGAYVEAVMANQMRHALGYRVVCIRGLDTTDIRSESALRNHFLELSVYFPHASTPVQQSASSSSPNSVGRPRRDQNVYVTSDGLFSEYHADDDSYTICECPGLNCLFSTAGMHFYVVRREDAAFTEPGKVEQILITREPPFGLLDTIADTESAMANLQEAIADEKALRRKLSLQNGSARSLRRRRHGGGGGGGSSIGSSIARGRSGESAPLRASSVLVTASVPSAAESTSAAVAPLRSAYEADQPVLMMRCAFPSCCDKMPAVPYYESVFFKRAAELNQTLQEVPHQPVAGAAFVIFKDSLCAFEFMQLFTARFGGMLSSLTATIAGPPGRIFQNSLTAGRCALYLRFLFIFVVYIGLILTWSIPISFLGSLESLSEIPGFGRFLTKFTSLSTTLQSLLNAYLPVVVLALFNVALPHIIRVLVRMMGAFNRMECDGGQLYMQYIFMVMTAVIAQAAFQGALTRLTDLLFDPNEEAIINFLVACVTPTTGYFYAKVVSAACLSTWMDLLDPIGILTALLLRGRARIQRNYDALFLPCEFEFPRLLSFDLMILSMGLLFHMTAPLLGLLTVVYFFVRYWSQRAKQTDRYRPTLSPAHDCTDFGVPAQVIRSVMWLYCFAETGGVLLMGLRDHSGGVMLCSLSLGVGIALNIFVHLKTRKWTASLACARHLSEAPHPFHHTHPVRYQQRQQQQQQPLRQTTSASTPAGAPSSASPQQQVEAEPTATTPLKGGATRGQVPLAPAPPSSIPSPSSGPSLAASGSRDGAPHANAAASDNLYETNLEDRPEERQLSAVNGRYAIQEDGAMESYEHMTLNQVLFDTTRNPFLSHLLPRKAGVTLRFQPKHQRLAPIDAAAEVRIMHETNFVVERYWDRGMTWFEEDTAGRTHGGSDDDDDVTESSGHDDEERSMVRRTSPAVISVPRSTSSRSLATFAPQAREENIAGGSGGCGGGGCSGGGGGAAVDSSSAKSRIATLAEAKRSAQGSPEAVVLPTRTSTYPTAADTSSSSPPPASARRSGVFTPAESPTPSKASSATPPPPPLPLHSAEERRTDEDFGDEPLQRSLAASVGTPHVSPTQAAASAASYTISTK